MSYEDTLDQEAVGNTEVTTPTKRVRPKKYKQYNEDSTPQVNADSGAHVWGLEVCPNTPIKAPREPKVPKPIEYQLDEEGNQVLDEEGNPIPVKKARAPRLDADGNPIPRNANVYMDSQVIRLTDIIPNYRAGTKRGDIFASIKDGMTVGDFYALNGGKAVSHTFLVWYVNEAKVADVQ